MQQQNETSQDVARISALFARNPGNEWVEIEEQAVPADAYNNCCNIFIGQADVESRD